jgi:pimeloyl-ACP methyl ester carboxylesterase
MRYINVSSIDGMNMKLTSLLAGMLAGMFLLPSCVHAACTTPTQPLNEEGYVRIGGIEQWVTVKGRSCANPVVLMVHGGPGNPMSPYSAKLYGAWEQDYTLVQWDQRGAGRTYARNPPAEGETLTVERLAGDGNEVAAYIAGHLGKRKLILMGSSWGSILGVHMVKARPELYAAYVGTAQVVNGTADQAGSYAAVMARARSLNDQDVIGKLDPLGTPPWTNPRNFGILRRAIRKYEGQRTEPASEAWWQAEAQYATPQALADYEAGEDYSFLHFVGMKGDGMASRVDLPALGAAFSVPVFLVQGEEDLLTLPAGTRRYYDSISAPQKDYVTIPRAGHDPNQPMVDTQFKLLQERVRKLAE